MTKTLLRLKSAPGIVGTPVGVTTKGVRILETNDGTLVLAEDSDLEQARPNFVTIAIMGDHPMRRLHVAVPEGFLKEGDVVFVPYAGAFGVVKCVNMPHVGLGEISVAVVKKVILEDPPVS